MKQAAIFLDRDGTLIDDPGYVTDSDQVRLLPGAAEAVRSWNQAGYRVVVVSNQSALARGLITESQLEDINAQMELYLENEKAEVDAIYCCPYLDGPEAVVPKYRRDSNLRKPRPGLLLKAAEDLNIDLSSSWMIGDSAHDVQAGLSAGCRTILLSPNQDPPEDVEADFIVRDLPGAAGLILDGAAAAIAPSPSDRDQASLTTPETSEALKQDGVLEILRDIRSMLQQQRRGSVQPDFSLSRLAATLFQMIAVALLLWGGAALVGGEPGFEVQALVRFVLAGVVQLIALTLFLVDRSK